MHLLLPEDWSLVSKGPIDRHALVAVSAVSRYRRLRRAVHDPAPGHVLQPQELSPQSSSLSYEATLLARGRCSAIICTYEASSLAVRLRTIIMVSDGPAAICELIYFKHIMRRACERCVGKRSLAIP